MPPPIFKASPQVSAADLNWLSRAIANILRGLQPLGMVDMNTGSVALYPQRPGGGNSSQRYKIVTIHDNHLKCHTWDGTTEGSDAILIAKPTELQVGPSLSRTITRWNFVSGANITITMTATTGFDIHDPSVIASATGLSSENWYITPGYEVGGVIYADSPSGGTGVSVSGTALTLMDDNRMGREWGRLV